MASFDEAFDNVMMGGTATRPSWGDRKLVASGIGRKDLSLVDELSSVLYQPTYEDATALDWLITAPIK